MNPVVRNCIVKPVGFALTPVVLFQQTGATGESSLAFGHPDVIGLGLRPPPVYCDPETPEEYLLPLRSWQANSGLERTANGRLRAERYPGGKGECRNHYIPLITSDDHGATSQGSSWMNEQGERSGVSSPDGVEEGLIRTIDDFDRSVRRQILMAAFTGQDVLDGEFRSPNSRSKALMDDWGGEESVFVLSFLILFGWIE